MLDGYGSAEGAGTRPPGGGLTPCMLLLGCLFGIVIAGAGAVFPDIIH
jgi:hypothetical protein